MKSVQAIRFAAIAVAFLALVGCGGGEEETVNQDGGSILSGDGAGGSPTVRVSSDIAIPTTWYESNAYVVDSDVQASSTLVIQAGTIVKFAGHGRLSTVGDGTIIAEGASSRRIRFTSIKDDASGGDTNGDGNATGPSPGDWDAIRLLGANGSVFRNCDFRYGGGGGCGALHLGATSGAVVDGCVFADNDGGDPGNPWGALVAMFSGGGTTITNNAFFGNSVPLTIDEEVDLDASNRFHDPVNPGRGNRYNGIFVRPKADLTAPRRWFAREVPFVLRKTMEVDGTLALGPGVVLKFQAGTGLYIANRSGGSLVTSPGNVFTSFRDDAQSGDTNGDGSVTVPQAYDWEGIRFDCITGAASNYADWKNVFYDTY